MQFRGASIVYHKDKLILFGGCKDFDCYNKVYSFDIKMKTLFEIVAKGTVPNARQGHCVIKYGQEMIIIGGNNEEGFLNDIYSLDLEHFIWQKLQPDNPMAFTGRTGHSCVMDDIQRIIIFGGRKMNGLTDDLFYYPIFKNVWVKAIPAGKSKPQARVDFPMNNIHNQLWVFGGYTGGEA